MDRIHDDLTVPVRVDAASLAWSPSPSPGVERRRIARVGDEVARVTSLVRYAPGSTFSEHTHEGGEEFFVLEGVFSDEHGDHPAGTWVRNGVGSRHSPRTGPGCVIFVKLWWQHPEETRSARIPTHAIDWEVRRGGRVQELRLWDGPHDHTRLLALAPGVDVPIDTDGGLEVFVLEGSLDEPAGALGRWGWMRLPAHTGPRVLKAGAEGSRLYVKSRHLANPPPLPGSIRP